MLSIILSGVLIQILAILFTSGLGIGWIEPTNSKIADHMTVALFTSLWVLFIQTMVMFYILGVGKRIKDLISAARWAVGEKQNQLILLKRSERVRKKIFPFAVVTMFLTFITFWLGGATHTQSTSDSKIHLVFAILTLTSALVAAVQEFKWMPENFALSKDAQEQLGEYEQGETMENPV